MYLPGNEQHAVQSRVGVILHSAESMFSVQHRALLVLADEFQRGPWSLIVQIPLATAVNEKRHGNGVSNAPEHGTELYAMQSPIILINVARLAC